MATAVCPSRETLFQYSIGILNGQQRDDLDEHLDSCPECQATIMTLDDTDDTVVGRLRMPPNDSFMDEPQLQAALKAARELPLRRKGPFSPSDNPAEIPKTLGEYQVLEELGRGGMGTVYKALHTKLDRVVAIKILSRNRMGDQPAISRFEREMKAIGRLSHANIVQAHDAREIDDMPVLIMEFIDGLDLAELARRVCPLPVAEACELVRRTVLALQYAHEHGLVHRDIKPSNIMLSKTGEVKLLDLGLARFYAEAVAGEEMTGSGQAMGTADYMAPEQASDSRTVDIRADIYSLGCTLYKLLSGRAPFSGPEYRGTLDKMNGHVRETPPPIRQFVPDLPEEPARILERMIAKNSADRFTTPAEVAAVIEPFCLGADLPGLIDRAVSLPRESWAKAEKSHDANFNSPRPSTLPRRRPILKIVLIGLAFFGVLALGFGAGILIKINKDGKETTIEVPTGSSAKVDAEGQVDVTLPHKSASKGQEKQYNNVPMQFGKERELVVNAFGEGKGSEGLDLAAGKLINVPQEFEKWPAQQKLKWGEENNVDLVIQLLELPERFRNGGEKKSRAIVPLGTRLTALWDARGEKRIDSGLQQSFSSLDPKYLGPIDHDCSPLGRICATKKDNIMCLVPFPHVVPFSLAFQTRKGNMGVLQILRFTEDPKGMQIGCKLAQPAAASSPVDPAAELKALQGQWKVVKVEKGIDSFWKINGKVYDLNKAKSLNFDNKSCWIEEAKGAGSRMAYSIDSNATPKTIDFQGIKNDPGEVQFTAIGIYQIDGDQLTICTTRALPWSETDQRPKRFAVESDSRDVLFTLKRPSFDGTENAGDRKNTETGAKPATDAVSPLDDSNAKNDQSGKTAEKTDRQTDRIAVNPPATAPTAEQKAAAERRSLEWTRLFNESGRLKSDDAESRARIAGEMTKVGIGFPAIKLLREALKINPDLAEAHNNLGYALLQPGMNGHANMKEAVQHYERALQLKPDYAEAHNNLALAIIEESGKERANEAIEHYRQALRLKPNDPEFNYNLGIAYSFTGEYEKLIEQLKLALGLKPNNPDAYFNMAVGFAHVGRLTEAIDAYHQAIRLNPNHFPYYDNLSEAYARLNRMDEAIDAAEKALEIAKSERAFSDLVEVMEARIQSFRGQQSLFERSSQEMKDRKKNKPQLIDPAAELKGLQGQWKVVKVDKDAKAGENNALDRFKIVDSFKMESRLDFRGAQLVLRNPGQPAVRGWNYAVDDFATPKAIDLIETSGGHMQALGIYEIKDAQLSLCLVPQGAKRPADFAADIGTAHALLILGRYEPSADEKIIAGEWEVIARQVDGKLASVDNGERYKFTDYDVFHQVLPNPMIATDPNGGWRSGGFKLDSEKTPKQIEINEPDMTDRSMSKTVSYNGIYRMSDGKLTIAYRKNGTAPEKFESAPGLGVTLLELEKPKPERGPKPQGQEPAEGHPVSTLFQKQGVLSALILLRTELVQNELGLTDAQKEKTAPLQQELMVSTRTSRRAASPEQVRGNLEQAEAEITKKLASILDQHQMDRLAEILAQYGGLLILSSTDAGKDFEFTDEQKEKFKSIGEEESKKIRAAFPPPYRSSSSEERKKRAEEKYRKYEPIRKETEEKIWQIMTPKQRDMFEKMIGKEIDTTKLSEELGKAEKDSTAALKEPSPPEQPALPASKPEEREPK